MTCSLAIVCEAVADRDTACGLADRVLCAEVDWIAAENINDYRQWRGFHDHEPFLAWKDIYRLGKERSIRAHGHFAGEPGAPDAACARLALLLLFGSPSRPEAVLLIRDDDRQTQRRQGLEQAREHARAEMPLLGPVIIGLAHNNRECWALIGFSHRDEREKEQLDELRRDLGFNPCGEAHRLTARHDHEPRSPKRILRLLTGDDWERQADCWRTTPLSDLEQRGQNNGLTAFLGEVRELLVPLFRPSTGAPP